MQPRKRPRERVYDELNQKAAYLRGIAEGLSIDPSTREGKLIRELIALAADYARALEDAPEWDNPRAGDDWRYVPFICPNCQETIEIADDSIADEEKLICPRCNEPIHISTEQL